MASNLITLSEYKTYAGISNPNQDSVINSLIPKVSQLVKSACRRTFVDYVTDIKTETYSSGYYFPLAEYPVISVVSVEYSEDYGQTYTTLEEYVDYVLDQENDQIVPIGTTAFPYAVNGYKVSYFAGYETLPADLKLAVMDLVTYYLKNDPAIHSPKAPGTNSVQIEYITNASLPAHIKRILDYYAANYL